MTWIGKESRPRLEPRILLEDATKSYHAKTRVSEDDIFDNRLISGDNLLALKALEQEFSGTVKCIFIDPPYNTGSAFTQYDDGVEHSIWLSLMRDRIEILWRLLSDDGSLWITIDDNECHYLKVLCDQVFGRNCFVGSVVWRSTDNSNNDAKQFSVDHNYILVYSKQPEWQSNKFSANTKRSHFKNPDNDPKGPWFDGNPLNSPKPRPNLTFDLVAPNGLIIKPPKNGWRWSKETLFEKIKTGEIRFTPDGTGIRRRTYLADMKGLPPSTVWADLDETGHNRQAKYELKNLFPERIPSELFQTPKPERLLKKILDTATEAGDWVLDSFAGSGTTGAVAHKMHRRWIMIELGQHCYSEITPRLTQVIDGSDEGGISELVDWAGGGGFRCYQLAPSLLRKDKFGNWVISKQYNAGMLAEAMCKFEGFTYAPSDTEYWIHGHSTERDFIYVTTQTLSREQLQKLSDEVGENRSLLVCCSAFRVRDISQFPNLTIKKIPKMVLNRCEWGRDDYSLEIKNLPQAVEQEQIPSPQANGRKKRNTGSMELFAAVTEKGGTGK